MIWRRALLAAWAALWAGPLLVLARLSRRHRRPQPYRLFWGPTPLVNIRYLSDALRAAGHESTTVVTHDYGIFSGTRFDVYYDDVIARSRLPKAIARRSVEYLVLLDAFRSADVMHLPFDGGPLGRTPLAALEPRLLRLAGIRTVMLGYGADFFRYSQILETAMRHAMLISYPEAGRQEERIAERVRRWTEHADVIVAGFMVEGASRWDVLVPNYLVVDPERFGPRASPRPGGGPVTIVHAPNHRGVKGTEFIVAAVEALQRRGHDIEFVLLENVANEEVLATMARADICVDHCIGSGYGLFAIEGMASGAVVVANLEDEQRIGVHRHFGWLDECPIVSANIEQIEATLERLVTDVELRGRLAEIGPEYVRRFHSPATAQHLFGAIYRHLAGEDVDLMRLFHPLASDYMRRFEPLRPPLRRNRPL